MRHIILLITLVLILVGGCEKTEDSQMEPPNEQTGENQDPKNNGEDKEDPEDSKTHNAFSYQKGVPREITLTSSFENLETFTPDPLSSYNKANYHLHMKMDKSGHFEVKADIKVDNLSQDSWKEVLFYLVPNAFTEENKPEWLEDSSEVSIESVVMDGIELPYSLDNNLFYIELPNELKPSQSTQLTISYSFTVPENGIRFAHSNGNYYLAQWYPMLATYRDGWFIEEYHPGGESYHTAHSDFIVDYELPEEYRIFSSSDLDPAEPSNKGSLEQKNIKDFYMALTKNMLIKTVNVNDIEIRVIAFNQDEKRMDSTLELASKAIQFFESNIGPYAHKQLDIIFDEGGMEYSGIVTVGNYEDNEHTVVHEIAHQWFYGVVSNNPYYDTYLDEGLTQFSTYLYFIGEEDRNPEELLDNAYSLVEDHNRALAVHLPLTEYMGGSYFASNYEQPTIELWKIAGEDVSTSLNFLKTYFNLYAYTEVDTQEMIRFTKSYFQLSENDYFLNWINVK